MLWLAASVVNSSYSYFWDIERDWEIQFFTATKSACRPPFPGTPKPNPAETPR